MSKKPTYTFWTELAGTVSNLEFDSSQALVNSRAIYLSDIIVSPPLIELIKLYTRKKENK